MWVGAAELAPAMGMVGTLIGLVRLFTTMADPAAIGASMAIAVLATLYGALIGNLICLPLGEPTEAPRACRIYRAWAPRSAAGGARDARAAPGACGMTQASILDDEPRRAIWLITLADVMLLLVGFFVFLQANTKLDAKQIASGLRDGFGLAAEAPMRSRPTLSAASRRDRLRYHKATCRRGSRGARRSAHHRPRHRSHRRKRRRRRCCDGFARDPRRDRARAVAATLVRDGRPRGSPSTPPGAGRAVQLTIAFAGQGNQMIRPLLILCGAGGRPRRSADPLPGHHRDRRRGRRASPAYRAGERGRRADGGRSAAETGGVPAAATRLARRRIRMRWS